MKLKPHFYRLPLTFYPRSKSERGQFVPISAMVMFTMVIMMVATVNIYKVARAKLKVQNLADAAALNLAAKEAQAMNVVSDRNEWMNHMVAGNNSASADPSQPNAMPACGPDNPNSIPGISCVEVVNGRGHIFHSKDGATNYARLVQTINKAQQLFVRAYDSFLGADDRTSTSGSSLSGAANYQDLLKNDIPDLNDVNMVAWNSVNGENQANTDINSWQDAKKLATSGSGDIRGHMDALQFDVDHDIQTKYYREVDLIGGKVIHNAAPQSTSFSSLLNSQTPVGWMVPALGQNAKSGSMPQISVKKGNGGSVPEPGVGVYVVKSINLPVIGAYNVSARSKAYVVTGAGSNGGQSSNGAPQFRPTYWVKLAND